MDVRRVIQRGIRLAGLSVTRYPTPNTLAWQIRQVLKRVQVAQVLDVGAHHGEFATMLRTDVGYRGPIVSFEPHAASFAMLQQACGSDPLWRGHRVALGASRATMTLNVSDSSDMNSLLSVSTSGAERFPGVRTISTEDVSVVRLDSYPLADGPTLLKVDTQGYDHEVLRGAQGVMERIVALVLELSVTPVYEGTPSMTEMVALVQQWGFQPVGLFPVSKEADHLRVIEFDGVFMRRS